MPNDAKKGELTNDVLIKCLKQIASDLQLIVAALEPKVGKKPPKRVQVLIGDMCQPNLKGVAKDLEVLTAALQRPKTGRIPRIPQILIGDLCRGKAYTRKPR